MKPEITVITPTLNRDTHILRRCCASIRAQVGGIPYEHVICSDGLHEPLAEQVANEFGATYTMTLERKGNYGAGIRAHLLPEVTTPFICHVDDDNVLLPDYFLINYNYLNAVGRDDAVFAISKCIWFKGDIIKVLKGYPVVEGEVDTIQGFFYTDVMQEHGWLIDTKENGYRSDGKTYESMAKRYPHLFINEILSIHF